MTGLGMVSPLGNSVAESWGALVAGGCGIASISRFDAGDLPTRVAGEVRNLDVGDYVDQKAARRMDRCAHLALAAARQAHTDSGLNIAPIAERVGTAIATALGGVESFETTVLQMHRRGPSRVSPFSIVQTLPNLPAGWVSIELGTRGPLLAQCTACAASNMAIGDSLDAIRLGRADVMFCGGTEAPVTPVAIASFAAMRALSTRNNDPSLGIAAVRPRTRRLRHSRGSGGHRSRGTRTRSSPRRPYLRRADRLRHLIRRQPRLRPGSRRPQPGPRASSRVHRRRHRCRRSRLRQRARDINAGRRHRRNASTEARPRSGQRPQHARLVDQGRDRAHARRRRRSRSRVHHPRPTARRPTPHDQSREHRSRLRPRLHPQHRTRPASRDRRLELLRLRRPQHSRSLPALALRIRTLIRIRRVRFAWAR